MKKDIKLLQSLAGYYRQFVKDFSTIATPLSDFTKNSCPDKLD